MKLLIVLAVLTVVACVIASPADKKSSSPSGASCPKICTADYSPICAKPKDGKGSEITFGNGCVMENYNCEKSDKPYEKSAEGECEGKAPVRLS